MKFALLLLAAVTFTGCAHFMATESEKKLQTLYDCAAARSNELDQSCFDQHSKDCYEGEVLSVKARYLVEVAVAVGGKGEIHCRNEGKNNRSFLETAKKLHPKDKVKIKGNPVGIRRSYLGGYWHTLDLEKCQIELTK